jgi:hypothetical protein
MPEWLQRAVPEGHALTPDVLIVRLTLALFFGFVAAGVHFVTTRGRGREDPRPFLATLVLLSVLIALVTLVIGSSVERAFTLVGALAIVRFRTVVEDTRDTAFVIYAVAVGMAAGSGYFVAPMLAVPPVMLAAWLFRPTPTRPGERVRGALLVVRVGMGRPTDEQVRAVLDRVMPGYRLSGVATAKGGSALEVTYAVPDHAPEKALVLVTELNLVEGVQAVELKED